MKIKWTGFGDRIIQPYVWNKENGFIHDVPLEVAAELITYPGNQFKLVEEKEMPAVISFVEGDSRPIDELKAKKSRRKSKKSTSEEIASPSAHMTRSKV